MAWEKATMKKPVETASRILIIKPGAIGDLLQLTPVIRALKRRFPGCVVDVIVGSTITAQLFRHNPDVREAIVFDKRGEHRSFRSILKIWQRLRRTGYDLVLNFQRSNLKMWLLATAVFPCRVLVYHKSRRPVHAVLNYMETLAPLDISTSDVRLELTPGPEDRAFAAACLVPLTAGKPIIAVNPGASHPVNRWPERHFSALADMLSERLSARVVIIGGGEDVALAAKISAESRSRPTVLAGKASLLQTAAILEKCTVLVTGDTGPLHMATAVGTRVVALFGAADPGRTGPLGPEHRVIQAEDVNCVPCRSRTCANRHYQECMEKISVEQVFTAVAEVLSNSPV
jgi:heptosyltransferase-2